MNPFPDWLDRLRGATPPPSDALTRRIEAGARADEPAYPPEPVALAGIRARVDAASRSARAPALGIRPALATAACGALLVAGLAVLQTHAPRTLPEAQAAALEAVAVEAAPPGLAEDLDLEAILADEELAADLDRV